MDSNTQTPPSYPNESPQATDLIGVGIVLAVFLLAYYSLIAAGRTIRALYRFAVAFPAFFTQRWEKERESL